jgi:hypothetical protein
VIRLFSGTNPLSVFFLFLLGILLQLNSFLYPAVPVLQDADGWLYALLLQWLAPAGRTFPIIYPLLSYIILFIQAVVFNSMVNEKRLFTQSNLLFAFSILFIAAIIPSWGVLSSSMIIHCLCLWLWSKWTGLYNTEQVKQDVFNMGFVIGIASFLYGPAFFLMLFLYVALLISRPFRINEWLIASIGFILPFYLLTVYVYVANEWTDWAAIFPEFLWKTPVIPKEIDFYITLSFVLFPLIGGLLYSRTVVVRMLVHQRKIWALNLVNLIIILLPAFAMSGQYSALLLFPLVFYITLFLSTPRKKRLPEIWIWLGFIWMILRSFVDL